MKVVFTDDALRDVDDILHYISEHYPQIFPAFENRLRAIVIRITEWPESAPEVAQRPGVRAVPFIRYPYRLFYRVFADRVEILHVCHAARDDTTDAL